MTACEKIENLSGKWVVQQPSYVDSPILLNMPQCQHKARLMVFFVSTLQVALKTVFGLVYVKDLSRTIVTMWLRTT